MRLALVGKNVGSNSYGNSYHQTFEPDGVEDVGAEEERGPQQGEDVHFDTAGDDLVLPKIADVRAELGMAHQPVVHAGRAAVIAECCEQQQRGGG